MKRQFSFMMLYMISVCHPELSARDLNVLPILLITPLSYFCSQQSVITGQFKVYPYACTGEVY